MHAGLAAAAGATQLTDQALIPIGKPEGDLPSGDFVFASPFAGWASKQWPLENYRLLAQGLKAEGLPLVVNVPPGFREKLAEMPELKIHESGLPGLIDGTRRATAIIGVDSGPMHLAAALGKPVWILNRFDACWRWLADRSDSPWYPTVKLYRQLRPGDWESVLRQVAADLAHIAACGRFD